MTEYCHKHKVKNVHAFRPCKAVKHIDEKGKDSGRGKFTVSTCSLKKRYPNHTHCSDKACTNVSNLKHVAYTKEWKRHDS